VELQITTHDRFAEFSLFDTDSLSSGETAIELAGGGIQVRYEGTYVRKALDFPNIISAVAQVSGDLAIGVAGGALWDFLKGLKQRPERLEIDRIEVEFEEGEVRRIIEERLRIRDE